MPSLRKKALQIAKKTSCVIRPRKISYAAEPMCTSTLQIVLGVRVMITNERNKGEIYSITKMTIYLTILQ